MCSYGKAVSSLSLSGVINSPDKQYNLKLPDINQTNASNSKTRATLKASLPGIWLISFAKGPMAPKLKTEFWLRVACFASRFSLITYYNQINWDHNVRWAVVYVDTSNNEHAREDDIEGHQGRVDASWKLELRVIMQSISIRLNKPGVLICCLNLVASKQNLNKLCWFWIKPKAKIYSTFVSIGVVTLTALRCRPWTAGPTMHNSFTAISPLFCWC